MVGIFSDLIGRKKTVAVSILMSLSSVFLILVFPSAIIKSIGFLIWGTGGNISFSLGVTYLSEIVAEEDRPKSYAKLSLAFAFGVIANPIVFLIFKDWVNVLIFFYGFGLIAIAIAFFLYV